MAVELDQVECHYGDVGAVRGVSFHVAPGEFCSLLGPSGSGKTTTLRATAGFLNPSAGVIRVNGTRVNSVPASKRGLGFVYQDYALFPHMSVYDNVAFPLVMRKVPRAELQDRVRKTLSIVGLADLAERKPAQLSGGQQQRVAVARAVSFEPNVLLMDEPLGALDRNLRAHMQLELKSLQRRLGIAVMYVTHDQEEAMSMSDRIVVMRDGLVEQWGRPSDLYERPQSAFVATFIGESNLMDCTVIGGDESRLTVRCGDGLVLSGHASGDAPVPRSGRLQFRPERVAVSTTAFADAGPEWNILQGQVLDTVYLGNLVRLRVRPGAERRLTEGDLWCQTSRELFRAGDTVHLRWRVDDSLVLL